MTYLTDKLSKLTEELFAVTRRGSLAWQAGSAEGVFIADIGTLRVAIEQFVGADGLPAVAVLLSNQDGRVVQRYTDADLSDHVPDDDAHRSYWEQLAELYEMARWSAEGVFALIDDLLGNLSRSDGAGSDGNGSNGDAVPAGPGDEGAWMRQGSTVHVQRTTGRYRTAA